MHKHKEAQEGRVELNIGGYRFETSVQTLRRIAHTFFDAYFSGRYAQDMCADGSIFVDRDGEHFGHVLDYMRDGHVSVADAGAYPSVSLLRALKREFGFYCIELSVELPMEPEEPEMAYVMGGYVSEIGSLSSMERYDASSDQWIAAAAMGTARNLFGACVIAGELYVLGGRSPSGHPLSLVEKYSPSSDTWSAVAPLPAARRDHVAVAVGSFMYILGGNLLHGATSTVLKFDFIQGTWSDIYAFSGEDEAGEQQDSVFKYDTVANIWSTLAPMPFSSRGLSASVLDGMVYIMGDVSYNVWRFQPSLGAWSVLMPMSRVRHFCTSFARKGSLYVAGGIRNGHSVERYDVATDSWTVMADMLEGRSFFRAATIQPPVPAEKQDLFDALMTQVTRHHKFQSGRARLLRPRGIVHSMDYKLLV
jgi:hypothetical protein